jgi:multimeric flavodoxin WrbA
VKVLVINGSPRKERGATGGILKLFIRGMEQEGADVETIYTRDLKVSDCRGCFNCWTKTPGKCIQNDDAAGVLNLIAASELLVLATPVYVDGMTGSMKTLLDRFIPLLHGRFVLREEHCRHPLREGVKAGKVALVSVSGFTEVDNFDPLVTHVRALSKNMNREYVGALLRPVAWLMWNMEGKADISDVHEAIQKAGEQLVTDGEMAPETLQIVARELAPRDVVIEMMHEYYGDN